jgi:Bacterial archaeo-eukaryotic release factor family 10
MDRDDLRMLSARPERESDTVLSVYLNTDQSKPDNLNRGFEQHLKDMIALLQKTINDAGELERFHRAALRIKDFVSSYEVGSRGIVIFFDESDGFFWHADMELPIRNQARWNHELFLQPLAAAMDESEPYAVALMGHASLRLFAISLGEMEELVAETFPSRTVRHIRTVGMDRIGSASQVQRKADEQIRWNLRHVKNVVDSLLQSRRINRLMLAGTPETTEEFHKLLPKRLASRVIGSIDIATGVSPERLLAAAEPVAQKHEHDSEVRLVDELVTEAAKRRKAVTGLSNTLNAINQARVWRLVYSDEFRSPGLECLKCAALFSTDRAWCLYCSAALRPVTDVVEHAIEHALRKGAMIEVVTGKASEALINAGGIGASLRARTATIKI